MSSGKSYLIFIERMLDGYLFYFGEHLLSISRLLISSKLTSRFSKLSNEFEGPVLKLSVSVDIDLATTMKGHFFHTEKMNSNRTSCPLEKNIPSHVILTPCKYVVL